MLEAVQEVTYFASNIEAYWEWIRTTTGAALLLREPHLIQCRIGEAAVTLHPADEKGHAGPGGQVAYWRVADIDAAVTRFEEYGARRYRGPIKGLDGPWVAQVQDPWGNIWGLIQQELDRNREAVHQEG